MGVQYYKAASREFRRLSGLIWQKYWTQHVPIISINHALIFDRTVAFEPGGRRFESVPARSNALAKSDTWQSLRAEYAPKIEYPENSQVLDGSALAGRMGEFALDQQYCSQIFRRSPASPPQCVRNAGVRVATLGECGIRRRPLWFAPSRFGASTRALWRLRNGRFRPICGRSTPCPRRTLINVRRGSIWTRTDTSVYFPRSSTAH